MLLFVSLANFTKLKYKTPYLSEYKSSFFLQSLAEGATYLWFF